MHFHRGLFVKLLSVTSALLLALPATMLAQRGGGDGRQTRGEPDETEAVFSTLSSRSIQRFDPVKVILDKKKDLKLDDKQIADLTQLEKQVQWNIKRLAARIDTAQKLMNKEGAGGGSPDFSSAGRGGRSGGRGLGGGDPDAKPETPSERRDRVLRARQTILEAVADLQVEHKSSEDLALSYLHDASLAGAQELLKKHDDDLAKMLKDAGLGPKAQH
jgi:hypothetical protein